MIKQVLPQLIVPTTISRIEMYRDGGSIGVELLDSCGTKFELCVDGRLGTNTLDRLYVNARHPSIDRAELIPRGADVEKRIVKYLQGWLDDNWSIEEQESLKDTYGQRDLNVRESKVALCISVIDRIKNLGK